MKGIIADLTHLTDMNYAAAISDTVLRNLKEDTIVLQLMNHKSKNISMGYDDMKAPYVEKGIQFYKDQGYTVGIRNSGGRSVVNDPGILNWALLFKTTKPIEDVYLYLYHFTNDALKPLGITLDFGEVKGAYCPGTFDFSIDNQKVAGTAQRRIRDNTLVGGYISVVGNQQERSELIAKFYEITQDELRVDPHKLTTLQEKTNQELSIDIVKNLFIKEFKKITSSHTYLNPKELDQKKIEASKKRIKDAQTKFIQ